MLLTVIEPSYFVKTIQPPFIITNHKLILMLGDLLSQYYKNTKNFFKSKVMTDALYLLISAPIISAQILYVSKNYSKIDRVSTSFFGLNGRALKSLGKWILYILPAVNALLLAMNLTSISEFSSKFNCKNKKLTSIRAVVLSIIITIFCKFFSIKLTLRS